LLATALQQKQFDVIIVLSVAQYLKDAAELEQMIRLLHRFMKPNGKIILADIIDEHTSSVKDALSLLGYYIKIGKVPTFVRFMSYLLFSDYRKISGKMPLLQVPENAIQSIAANNGLNYEKVKGLTVQPTRCSYVFSNR
jgi:2-polyprenyl-3-methyl-5-hydroxy-6-metoxy-1,4-benzoquinol methylase